MTARNYCQRLVTSSAGVVMGTYPGATEADALDAMARDAGYRDQQHAAEEVGAFDGSVVAVADASGSLKEVLK